MGARSRRHIVTRRSAPPPRTPRCAAGPPDRCASAQDSTSPGGSDRVREVQRHLAAARLPGRPHRRPVRPPYPGCRRVVPGQARPAGERAGHARDGATSPGPDRCAGNDIRTRDRLAGRGRPEQVAAASRAPAWEAFRQLVGPRAPVSGGRAEEPTARSIDRALILLLAVDALLLIALLVQRRSRAATTVRHGPSAPVPARQHKPPAAAAEREGSPARRFAPPVPRPEERSPGGVPARSREGRS